MNINDVHRGVHELLILSAEENCGNVQSLNNVDSLLVSELEHYVPPHLIYCRVHYLSANMLRTSAGIVFFHG